MKKHLSGTASSARGISIAQLTRRLIGFLVIPTISLIVIYLVISYAYFMRDALLSQQDRLENSAQRSVQSLDDTQQFFHSVQSIPELSYMLDIYTDKRDILYSLLKTLRPQLDQLVLNSVTVAELKIYSIQPLLMTAAPFVDNSALPLTAEEIAKLSQRNRNPVIWCFTPSEAPSGIPTVTAYRKLTGYDYSKIIGYMGVTLSEDFVDRVLTDLEAAVSFYDGSLRVYSGDDLIYASDPPLSGFPDASDLRSGDSRLLLSSLKYMNCVVLEGPGLRVVVAGPLLSLSTGQPLRLLLLLCMVLIAVSFLLMRYSRKMKNLSGQITDFSGFMSGMNPETLMEYHPASQEQWREMITLTDSYNHLISSNRRLRSQVREMELLTEESRYQALQAQIHPHFIYGTLENIRMLALQNHDRDAASMIYSLSSLIRRSISISGDAVSLQDELDAAHEYLKIQTIRLGARFTYTEEICVDPSEVALPSFTLQPLLENAIVHGIAQTEEACELVLYAGETAGTVTLEVRNTGPAPDREHLSRVSDLLGGRLAPEDFSSDGHGRALYNIRERLRILSGGKAALQLVSENGWTIARITLTRSLNAAAEPEPDQEVNHVPHSDRG